VAEGTRHLGVAGFFSAKKERQRKEARAIGCVILATNDGMLSKARLAKVLSAQNARFGVVVSAPATSYLFIAAVELTENQIIEIARRTYRRVMANGEFQRDLFDQAMARSAIPAPAGKSGG
jgi:hypothetical protein